MVRIELPDTIPPSHFLNKTPIREHPLQHTILTVKYKLDEPFCYFQFTQIQEPVSTDRKNTLTFFCQDIKGSYLLCIVFLQKPRLYVIDIQCLIVDEDSTAIMRRIFQMVIKGYGVMAIADALTADRIMYDTLCLRKMQLPGE